MKNVIALTNLLTKLILIIFNTLKVVRRYKLMTSHFKKNGGFHKV